MISIEIFGLPQTYKE